MVFGGWNYPYLIKTVAQFEYDEWEKLGDLRQFRFKHNTILFDGDILIVGGERSR